MLDQFTTIKFLSAVCVVLLSCCIYLFNVHRQCSNAGSESQSESKPLSTITSLSSHSSEISSNPSSLRKFDHCKMILCVRNDLQMGKGKIAAQCCHAAVGLINEMRNNKEKWNLVKFWENRGAMKIAVKVNNLTELEFIQKSARQNDLSFYLVIDAGHTQVEPNTKTVLAILGETKIIDKITGHLKLL